MYPHPAIATPGQRLRAWIDSLFVDHAVLRLLWTNGAEVAPGMWRANQPLPWQFRRWARRGVRTVINLRGARACGSYALEKEVCAELGLALIDFPVESRGAPKPEMIARAEEMFASIAYPALMHCKSGADRAGLMSALYLILREGRPVAEAAPAALSLRFGHFRQGKTGILDRFFALYLEANAEAPIAFRDWVASAYDPVALKRDFRPSLLGNALVDRVLRRE